MVSPDKPAGILRMLGCRSQEQALSFLSPVVTIELLSADQVNCKIAIFRVQNHKLPGIADDPE